MALVRAGADQSSERLCQPRTDDAVIMFLTTPTIPAASRFLGMRQPPRAVED